MKKHKITKQLVNKNRERRKTKGKENKSKKW